MHASTAKSTAQLRSCWPLWEAPSTSYPDHYPIHSSLLYMKNSRTFTWLILLAGAILPAHAERTTEIGAGAEYDNNASNGQLDRDIKGDSAAWASLSAGQSIEVREGNSLTATGDLMGRVFNRFEGLNNLSLGVTVADRMKLGLGATAPWIRTYGSAARLQFRNDIRNGWLYGLGLGAGKRVGERWDLQAEYRFDKRTGENTTGVVPGLSGAVFDQTGHGVLLDGRYSYDDTTVISLGYAWRRGDVVSTTQRNFTIFRASTAIAEDPAFGDGGYAYKLKATTQIISLGASEEIDRHSSLNAGFQRQVTHATGPNAYYNSVPSVTYLYSY
jgi:hypothetical protein